MELFAEIPDQPIQFSQSIFAMQFCPIRRGVDIFLQSSHDPGFPKNECAPGRGAHEKKRAGIGGRGVARK